MEIHYTGLSHTLQTAAIAALVFAVCALLPKLNYRSHLAKLPISGGAASGEKQRQAYITSAKKMYFDGYEKVSIVHKCILVATDKITVQRFSVSRCSI
jgi:hypothetical protein